MGKTGKWLKSFLTGKKERKKEKEEEHETVPQPSPNKQYWSGPVPGTSAKEKKRWSFRRSKELVTGDVKCNNAHNNNSNGVSDENIDKTRQAIAVAVNKAVAAEMAVRLKSVGEDESAVKIQAYFRAYLARKALRALRGLVKLQSLVRAQLVRRQATEALRRMQALVAAQKRLRTQRLQIVKQEVQSMSSSTPNHRRSPQHSRFKQSYEMEKNAEENIKTVVMDMAEPRISSKSRNSSYSMPQFEKMEHKHSLYSCGSRTPTKSEVPYNHSPTQSGLTDLSQKGQSDHFEAFSFKTAQSSPQYHSPISNGSIDYQFYPNYMSNTESSRAKVRSHSAPRQRHETYERQLSRKKLSLEGRSIPRGVKMQRSVSQVGIPVNGLQFPWHLKVDRTSVSVIDSECGSCSSSVLTNNYCRSLAAYEVYGISAEPNAITE